VLNPEPPQIIAMIAVAPLEVTAEEASWLKRDTETERIAMEASIIYEKNADRRPEDVSDPSLELGFDIRSWVKTKIADKETESVGRCIEVKGRKGSGPVLLTPNEFQKAARFAEQYYLYIVPVADSRAGQIRIFNDPTRRFDFKWAASLQRYLLEEQTWKKARVDE